MKANEWVQAISPTIGGKGGGREGTAQAIGTNVDRLSDAVETGSHNHRIDHDQSLKNFIHVAGALSNKYHMIIVYIKIFIITISKKLVRVLLTA